MNPWGNEWGFCFQSHVSAFWPHPGYICLLYRSSIYQKWDWRPLWLMHNEERNKDKLFIIEGGIHQTVEIKNSFSPKQKNHKFCVLKEKGSLLTHSCGELVNRNMLVGLEGENLGIAHPCWPNYLPSCLLSRCSGLKVCASDFTSAYIHKSKS